jgi:uncharacterized protein (TIGR02145 family)
MNRISEFFFILLLFCSFPDYSYPQGEFNNWYFGQHAGITFNSGSPIPLNNCSPLFDEDYSPASISDSLGNLWFYALYSAVFNRNNVIMPNGSNLLSRHGVEQPLLPVQKVGDDSSYYLLTMDVSPTPPYPPIYGLRYSIIDMRLDGGLGDIVSSKKNISITSAALTGSMLGGTRHHNNHDAWIIVREYTNSNHFLSYLITSTGIDSIPIVSNSLIQFCPQPCANNPEMLKISADGTKMICMYDSIIEYCHFNDTTGIITPLFRYYKSSINHIKYRGNAEFSIDSKYLYVSYTTDNPTSECLLQFDATKTDSIGFRQSAVMIDSLRTPNMENPFGLQRGPDNKIYCTTPYKDSLGVIRNPSQQGAGCNFQKNVICLLNNNLSEDGFPQFIQKYYVYIHHSNILCVNDSVNFTSSIWPVADSIHWDFGDPASGTNNYSLLPSPTHFYSTPGSYTLELFVKHIDHRTDTAWQTITILSSPQPNLGPNQTVCVGNPATFDAGACAGCTYSWKDLGSGLIVGTLQTYTTNQAGTYDVTVTNGNGCSGVDTVQLITTPVPSITNNPLSKSICSGDSTNITLTSSPPGAIFHWTVSLTSGNITGFSADSGLAIKQVLINSLLTPGVVTYSITPKVGSCAGSPVDYVVTVTPGLPVSITITASMNNICSGTPVTFTANPANQGAAPFYQWKVNGINSGISSTTYTYPPINGDIVSCVLTSSIASCISNNPATSNAITMVVNPLLPVSITLTALPATICAGSPVNFTANPTNGGLTPSYSWKVNGTGVGANSSTYSYIPLNGDLVSCTLTSSELCTTNNPASSIQYPVSVTPLSPVSITISPSQNPFCLGSPVTFTAIPGNGGALPAYQWKVNGVGVGPNNSSYTYNPANGDLVTCVLTSSATCTTGNPASSNSVTMNAISGIVASVTLGASSNPFCPGSSVTFTANPTNGGAAPAYSWKENGINVGTNSHTFTYNPSDGDSIRCVMTSNMACVTGNPASSPEIIMSGTLASVVTFTSCFDTITAINAKPIRLKGGIPLGGIYSGPGVNSGLGIFTQSVAGTGMKTITYTYTNAALCSSSKNIHVIVQPSAAFTCGNNLIDIRDNTSYTTIKIGSQCWLAKNLDYGTVIASSQDQRDDCVPEKYCYQDNPINCGTQGGLYQWDKLMQFDNTPADQGLCPPAWHIPTENDWTILFSNYINNGFAGSPLKYSGFSGFNALLYGARHINSGWDFNGFATFFWSSTSYGGYKAWAHGMNESDPSVSIYPASRVNAFSVRCVED